MSLIRPLKRMVFATARQLGVTSIVRDSRWRRSRLLILCYHGVSLDDEDRWNPEMFIREETLASRFEMLRRDKYEVLPLEEGLRHLAVGTLPERAVSLTFDDGMYNFHKKALPLLSSYGFPSTVYLATYYSNVNRPVFSFALPYALWKGRLHTLSLRKFIPGEQEYDLESAAARSAVAKAVELYVAQREFDAAAKDEFLASIAARIGVDWGSVVERGIQRLMTPEEVRDATQHRVSIELHTHRHRTPDDRALFLREITDNRQAIEAITGCKPVHFCYPSGEYRLSWQDWLRESGIVSATTCDPGIAEPRSDPLLLPRFVDSEGVSQEEFGAWVSGVAEMLPRRTKYAKASMRRD